MVELYDKYHPLMLNTGGSIYLAGGGGGGGETFNIRGKGSCSSAYENQSIHAKNGITSMF